MRPTFETVYRDANGQPPTPGHCIVPDNFEQTFTVTVRTMTPISEDRLRDLIQTKFEVLNCFKTANVVTVK